MTIREIEIKYKCSIWTSGNKICYNNLVKSDKIIYTDIKPVTGLRNVPGLCRELEEYFQRNIRENKLKRILKNK